MQKKIAHQFFQPFYFLSQNWWKIHTPENTFKFRTKMENTAMRIMGGLKYWLWFLQADSRRGPAPGFRSRGGGAPQTQRGGQGQGQRERGGLARVPRKALAAPKREQVGQRTLRIDGGFEK
jgi:hypothetical protein